MFKYHHLLPDEVGRQRPYVLFMMLDSLEDDENKMDESEMSEYERMFYGI